MKEIYFLVMHAGTIQREPSSPTLVNSRTKFDAVRNYVTNLV